MNAPKIMKYHNTVLHLNTNSSLSRFSSKLYQPYTFLACAQFLTRHLIALQVFAVVALTFACWKVVSSVENLTRVSTHNCMFGNHLWQYAAMQARLAFPSARIDAARPFGSTLKLFPSQKWGGKRIRSEEFIFYFARVSCFNGRFVPDNLHLLCCWPCGEGSGCSEDWK